MITLLIALVCSQNPPPPTTRAQQGPSRDGGTAWVVECTNCSGGGTGGGSSTSSNITQWNGATVDTNSGSKGAGTLRVVVATDQPQLSTALKVDGSGVVQPVSGPLTDTQLRAASVPVSLTSTTVTGTVSVSGTVTTTPPSNASTNVAQFGGSNAATGTGASGSGIPRVTVSNDSNVLATQSGTWTVQPGNTPNTAPWLATVSQGGNSAIVSSGGALKVDNSAVVQPVSASALPLPSGAATDATISGLLDGGVNIRMATIGGAFVAPIVTAQGVQYVQQAPVPPLNPFLPRCNPVRRTGCQP